MDNIVIGVMTNDGVSLCFRCTAEHYHLYPESTRTPILSTQQPDGFYCAMCRDRNQACPIYPTVTLTNTGIMRNGEIEYHMEVRDEETGMVMSYMGYGLGDIPIPPEWGGDVPYDPYMSRYPKEEEEDEPF